jgi:ribosomal protein S13
MLPALGGMALQAVAGLFAKKGLDLAAKAVNGAGNKALEFIEEKTGIKMDAAPDDLTPEEVSEIRALERDPATRVELEKLALERLKETHRHDETKQKVVLKDKGDAREMFEKSGGKLQAEVARKIFQNSMWMIPFLILINVLTVAGVAYFSLNSAVAAGVGTAIGLALGRSWDERKTVIEFLFGSSQEREHQDRAQRVTK